MFISRSAAGCGSNHVGASDMALNGVAPLRNGWPDCVRSCALPDAVVMPRPRRHAIIPQPLRALAAHLHPWCAAGPHGSHWLPNSDVPGLMFSADRYHPSAPAYALAADLLFLAARCADRKSISNSQKRRPGLERPPSSQGRHSMMSRCGGSRADH